MPENKLHDPVVESDLILVYVQEQPGFFARVEKFTPDHKPNWWQVQLLVLQAPPTLTTWILRREQINGEPFTMNGTPIRIEKVRAPKEKTAGLESQFQEEQDQSSATPSAQNEDKASGPMDTAKAKARILTLGDRSPKK